MTRAQLEKHPENVDTVRLLKKLANTDETHKMSLLCNQLHTARKRVASLPVYFVVTRAVFFYGYIVVAVSRAQRDLSVATRIVIS